MSANSKGSYSCKDRWGAYEQLPPSARKALQDAAFNWAAQPILTRWKRGARGYKTGTDIVARVAEYDRDAHRKDVKRGHVAP
jgi:hypothetical protein